MSTKPTQDEVVRLLDGAYDSSRMPAYGGAEFMAEVRAHAVSAWLVRGAILVGAAIMIAVAVIGYRHATRPQAMPDETPALDDSGGQATPTRLLDRNRMLGTN